ncbi:TetR/AcrR family transcriptional regulator [Microbacterium sp. VKM Ac-2923]|uniref:TetR/AcrR family transcriptional regulator n=1 Tax=Microbacterium sp. VKM Ac-2923 TaxID=2929476 RepID=UPI001FB5667F|nr:TetR/AcrR family transcriptional regulator [Microbacterium sp. VKM Ac-2923]MCJ1707686.1 TetR/AcrR family transcriptional regulator [Microbacterium sp. VKM Ac-2923]
MTAPNPASTSEDSPARRGRPGYDRDGILAVAVQVFNAQGYDATSVSDLARHLGLAKSALYHHFASKEELLSVALETGLGGLEAVLDDPRASVGPASERLRFVLTGATDVLVAQLPSVTLLLRVRGNSPVEQAALERRRVFDHRVTDLVAAAQAEGDVRDDVDAAVAARLLFGMINSVVEWYRPGGGVDGGRLGADIVRIALDGLRTA